jgi:hypothetical protein
MKCPFCNKTFDYKEAKIRSTPENRYYWGVCIKIISDELGYLPMEIHDMMKYEFLRCVVFIPTRDKKMDECVILKSTTSLSTVEFEEYLSNIRQWASEHSIYIPLPNEPLLEE